MSYDRIFNEMRSLIKNCPDGIMVTCDGDMYNWNCFISGPEGTSYETLVYEIEVIFRKCHPFKPPMIRFVTPIFHPNVSPDGSIWISLLHERWSPALTMKSILMILRSILDDPEVDEDAEDAEDAEDHIHIVNKDAYNLWISDKDLYKKYVKIWYDGLE